MSLGSSIRSVRLSLIRVAPTRFSIKIRYPVPTSHQLHIIHLFPDYSASSLLFLNDPDHYINQKGFDLTTMAATPRTPSEVSFQEFFSDEFEAIVASNLNSPTTGPVDWANYNLTIDYTEPEADGQTEAHRDLQAPQVPGEDALETFVVDGCTHTDEAHADPQAPGEDVLESFVVDHCTHTDEAHADPEAPQAMDEAVAQEPEEGRTPERLRRSGRIRRPPQRYGSWATH